MKPLFPHNLPFHRNALVTLLASALTACGDGSSGAQNAQFSPSASLQLQSANVVPDDTDGAGGPAPTPAPGAGAPAPGAGGPAPAPGAGGPAPAPGAGGPAPAPAPGAGGPAPAPAPGAGGPAPAPAPAPGAGAPAPAPAPAPSRLRLEIPQNAVLVGETATFQVQVTYDITAAAGAIAPTSPPTGNVTITLQGKTCNAALSPAGPGQNPLLAIGKCDIVATTAGNAQVTADYTGDTSYAPSTAQSTYMVSALPGVNPNPTAPVAPTLSLVQASDTGISNIDNKTSDDTPTVHVGLTKTGNGKHEAGDVVTILLGGAPVGTVTLTAADVLAGFVDIKTASIGNDGAKQLTATISRNNVQSSPSPVLSLVLDRTPPVITSAFINGNLVTVTYAEAGVGLAGGTIPPTLFNVVTDTASPNPTNNVPIAATVNPANNTVTLELTAPVTRQTTVKLGYVSDSKGVRDIAGNLAANLTDLDVTNVTSIPAPAPSPTPAPGPRLPSRPSAVAPPPASNVIVTTIQQPTQTAPGQPPATDTSAARFNAPSGIARDSKGNLYVSDEKNFTIRRIAPNGAVTTIAGKAGENGNVDGPAAVARFTAPGAITIDASGLLYVLDNRNLRRIALDGSVSTIVTTPATATLSTPNTFGLPSGLAVDRSGNVFVADYLVGVIWKVTPTGQVARFAVISSGIGNLTDAGPSGIAIDAEDNLYVTDLPYNLSAGSFSAIHKVTPAGKVTELFGPALGLLNARGIGIDTAGNLYINENLLIVKVAANRQSISSYQLVSPAGGTVTASSIVLNPASGIIYFTDSAKHNVNRLDPDGKIAPIAGSAGQAGAKDVP